MIFTLSVLAAALMFWLAKRIIDTVWDYGAQRVANRKVEVVYRDRVRPVHEATPAA